MKVNEIPIVDKALIYAMMSAVCCLLGIRMIRFRGQK